MAKVVLTGREADLTIIDNPQKADDASSETSRKGTHTWFDNTLLSRLNTAELTGFPGTRYDDQVDSTTQALDYLRNNGDVFIWARLGAKEDPFGALVRSLWPPIG